MKKKFEAIQWKLNAQIGVACALVSLIGSFMVSTIIDIFNADCDEYGED